MLRRSPLCAIPLLLVSSAFAQPAPTSLTELRQGLAQAFEQADTHVPGRRLGIRAALIKRARRVIPDVVVVKDEASYLSAIGGWTPDSIYPVLWDDGTIAAREDIARFVRAFGPRSVREYTWDQGAAPARRSAMEHAWSDAVGVSPDATNPAVALRDAQGVTPPGLVVTNELDPAWPAALALASGRMQPLVFADRPRGSIGGAMSVQDSDALSTSIERAAQASELTWDTLGDDLDAITLCLNTPVMIRTSEQPRTHVALSDRVGRLSASGGGARWAWCGQVYGNASQSAYRAMCALFLQAQNAWLFDTYPPTSDWAAFDATKARDILDQAGMKSVLHDAPRNGRDNWRLGTLRPIDAGLTLVNTKGRPEYFEFEYVRAAPGDVPLLRVPSIVHFVHSFSLARPGNRNTIAPRWLERGAYAYLGSVQEPYLHAFVPTPALAARLGSGFAWGAGARVDSGPVWKLALLGDPLITLSPAGLRNEGPLPLEGARSAADALPALLADQAFAEAIELLALLGRDEDASRLALGVIRDRPEAITPEVARAALPALVREQEHKGALDMARRIPDLDQRPVLLDIAWFAARAAIATRSAPDEGLALMRAHVRQAQLIRDAEEIGAALKPMGGGRAAAAYVSSLLPRANNDRLREGLERLASDFESGKR